MRNHHFFDQYARHHQMNPQGYVDTDEGRVLLADSEVPIDVDGQRYYRTGYAIERQGVDMANYHDYPLHEDTTIKFRLNEATIHARTVLKQLLAAGFYDDERKRDFST